MKALEMAIKAAGSQKELATALGLHKSAVSQWIRRNRVPADHALKMQEVYGIDAALFKIGPEPAEAL
jgi:DNA-binding transcriptional regulator YdaS (Cro superfamily)